MNKDTKTLIIIEDSVTDLKVLNFFANKLGVFTHIKNFTNGQEALEYIKQNTDEIKNIKLIITDINMPIMNGFDFCQQLENLEYFEQNHLPTVFFLSSSNNEADFIKAKSFKAFSGYLQKPISKEILSSIVNPKEMI